VKKVWSLLFFCTACSTVVPNVNRLSPQLKPVTAPAECQLVSVLKDSPAERAGLKIGDKILKINGVAPKDATNVSDLINKAPAASSLDIEDSSAALHVVNVALSNQHPRLGAVCDLSGWGVRGLSAAGNESWTLFEGPYAVTLSGIMDDAKRLTLIRAHIVNHGAEAIHVGPDLFSATDSSAKIIRVFTPEQAMCVLYGEKGVHLLSQQPKHKQEIDKDTAPSIEPPNESDLCAGVKDIGRMAKARTDYVEANAKSVAEDSLWPMMLAPEANADGLVYLDQPSALPLTIQVVLQGHTFVFDLGTPQPSAKPMPAMNLAEFFAAQKKGTPMRLTLKKGRVFVAKFLSYDPDEEKAWFDAPTDSMLRSVSFPLRSILSAEKIE